MIATRAGPRARAPAVAGSFYPGSAQTLGRTIVELVRGAAAQPRAQQRGVIAPHAGYAYSGPVAAQAFASVQSLRGRIGRAIVVGPAHFVPFVGIAAPSHAAFTTPLGEMPIDAAAIDALSAAALVVVDDAPHAPEHAIEVELPFLQSIFGDLPIVPLLFGSTSAHAVAAAIARVWSDDTLLVISTDLSHFESQESARRHDARTAAAIEAFDEAAIGPSDACGHLAVRGALIEASRRRLGIARLALRNSGEVTGDWHSVVGYGAWAFHQLA
jgi:AmmeMemoRadiSam system protein B